MISLEKFLQVFPKAKRAQELIQAFNKLFPVYKIDTVNRISAFLAQTGHETGGFRYFEENLNYSAEALEQVFSKYFSRAGRNAAEYAYKPEKIANVVYANRMGNGPEETGDGWKYRGRGLIQLTGKSNYQQFYLETGIDVINDPDLIVRDLNVAVLSALWFWEKNHLNTYADRNDITSITRIINGGYNGLEHRMSLYERLKQVFSNNENVYKRGSRGIMVQKIQQALYLPVDGFFGPMTEKAVIEFQKRYNLEPTGVVDEKTLKLLGIL